MVFFNLLWVNRAPCCIDPAFGVSHSLYMRRIFKQMFDGLNKSILNYFRQMFPPDSNREHRLEAGSQFFISLFQHDADEYILSKVSSKAFVSSVIRQKGEYQSGCSKKTKHQIFRKTNKSYLLKCSFFQKLVCFVFL